MSAALALLQDPSVIDATQREFIVDGTVTLTGNYPANGDAVSFAALGIPSNSPPNKVEFFEFTPSPGPASGYAFIYLPGVGQAGLLEIFNGTTQLSAGAYGSPPFSITGFALRFRVWFTSFN